MNLHGICVIQFVGGRYDAVDYVQDLSADIVYGTLQVLVSGSRNGELIV